MFLSKENIFIEKKVAWNDKGCTMKQNNIFLGLILLIGAHYIFSADEQFQDSVDIQQIAQESSQLDHKIVMDNKALEENDGFEDISELLDDLDVSDFPEMKPLSWWKEKIIQIGGMTYLKYCAFKKWCAHWYIQHSPC